MADPAFFKGSDFAQFLEHVHMGGLLGQKHPCLGT